MCKVILLMMNIFSFLVNIFKKPLDQIENNQHDKNNNSINNNDQTFSSAQSPVFPSNTIWSVERILSNRMLSDNEIYASIEILKSQFKHKNLKGLYDPLSMNQKKVKKFKFQIEYPDRFIQILHDGKLHWFTISNLKSRNSNQIQAYDSLYTDQTYLNNQILKNNLKKLILPNDLHDSYTECVELSIEPVQRQSDTLMCGLFAIAFAYDLCQDIDPINRCYDENKMRQHLHKCLTQNYFEQFPLKGETFQSSRTENQIIFIEL